MASISLIQPHRLSKDEAKKRVDRIFETYKDKYNATCQWRGDTIHLKSPSFEATAEVKSSSVDVNVSLGFKASLAKPLIESGLKSELETHFRA